MLALNKNIKCNHSKNRNRRHASFVLLEKKKEQNEIMITREGKERMEQKRQRKVVRDNTQ